MVALLPFSAHLHVKCAMKPVTNGHRREGAGIRSAAKALPPARGADDDERITLLHRVIGPLGTRNHLVVYGDGNALSRQVE